MGVKIEVLDLFSYFGLYFLAKSDKFNGFHAKEFIFGGFIKFQFFVFTKRAYFVKEMGVRRFSILCTNFNLKSFAKITTLTVVITSQKI